MMALRLVIRQVIFRLSSHFCVVVDFGSVANYIGSIDCIGLLFW